MHCSVMGREALEAAIAYYRAGKKKVESRQEDHGRLICSCFGVSEDLIRRVIRENKLTTVDEVTYYCKAGGGCATCVEDIEEILADETGAGKETAPAKEEVAAAKPKMTNIEKITRIQEVINSEIRPSLAKDGGDIELIDVEGNQVQVALRGACTACPSAGITLRFAVEQKLREYVSDELEVVEVGR